MAFSMDVNQQKAEFGYAYLRAVASVAGFTLTEPKVDHDSVDCTVQARGRVRRYSSPRLDVQLKCTAAEEPLPDPFPYRLGRKNYEDLRDGHRMSPLVLALLVVPEDLAGWMGSMGTIAGSVAIAVTGARSASRRLCPMASSPRPSTSLEASG